MVSPKQSNFPDSRAGLLLAVDQRLFTAHVLSRNYVSKQNSPLLQVENQMEEPGSQRGQSLVSASWARVFSSFLVSSSDEKPVTTTWITELPFLT